MSRDHSRLCHVRKVCFLIDRIFVNVSSGNSFRKFWAILYDQVGQLLFNGQEIPCCQSGKWLSVAALSLQ